MCVFGGCLGKELKHDNTLIEPIFTGIVVAIFNKYLLGKFDQLAAGSTACAQNDDDDCTSFSSVSITVDLGHVHVHF